MVESLDVLLLVLATTNGFSSIRRAQKEWLNAPYSQTHVLQGLLARVRYMSIIQGCSRRAAEARPSCGKSSRRGAGVGCCCYCCCPAIPSCTHAALHSLATVTPVEQNTVSNRKTKEQENCVRKRMLVRCHSMEIIISSIPLTRPHTTTKHRTLAPDYVLIRN